MNSVIAVAMKDLRLMSRDRLGMFFIIVFPLLMGILFGAISGSMGSGGMQMTLAIDDQDQSEISQQFVEAIQQNKGISIKLVAREQAMEQVRRGQLTGMIVVPEGFGETAGVLWATPPEIEVGMDPSRKAESGMVQGLVMQAVGSLVSTRFQDVDGMRSIIDSTRDDIRSAKGISMTQRIAIEAIMGSLDTLMNSVADAQKASERTDDAVGGQDDANVMGGVQLANIKSLDVTRQLDPKSPAALVKKLRSPWDISFPQATLWGLLACVAGFAVLTVRERSLGTMIRLQVAPIPRWTILAGKGLACFLAVIFVISMMTVVGYALGMRPKRWDLLAMATVSSAVCFVGVMMLVATFGKTEQAVSGAVWGANILMAMFGGGMIPIAFMPKFIKDVSNFTPVKWSILSLEGAIWREFSLLEMLLPCGVLVLIGVCGGLLGVRLLSRQLSQ